MSLLDRQANERYGKEPIEDSYRGITTEQCKYIEILTKKLAFSIPTRDVKIESIIGHARHHKEYNHCFDLWLLSKVEAGKVIGQFKKWIEERDGQ